MIDERVVVIGVGNEWATDDGIGPAVARAVGERLQNQIDVAVLDGEPARLLEAWTESDLAVLIDAARMSQGPPVRRLPVPPAVADTGATRSSHGLGICAAVELARALGRLPCELVTFVVAGDDFSPGRGITESGRSNVQRAVPEVCGAIESWIART